MSAKQKVTIPARANGLRVDQAIASLTDHSRGAARKLLERGSVFIDGRRVKVASRLVREGQVLEVHASALSQAPSADRPPPDIAIVHEDASIVVVNKPSGVFSAPTPETDQNDLLFFLKEKFSTLHLVHRLDRPTSGLMVLARTPLAARSLSKQLETRTLHRRYRAILAGRLTGSDDNSAARASTESESTASIGRTESTESEGQASTIIRCNSPLGGKEAQTVFSVLESSDAATLVTAELQTGRTHQIRLHAEGLGHPVAGDSKYGRRTLRSLPTRAPRLCLHAETLILEHPETGKRLELHAEWPTELDDYWQALREAVC